MQEIICKNCGSVNDFRIVEGTHQTAYCNGCDRYIKHLPRENKDRVIYFGKYKGTRLVDFTTKDHVSWLKWALNSVDLKPQLREEIIKHLGL